MAVDDLWYSKTRRGPDGKPLKLQRHGRGKRYRVRYTDPVTGKPVTGSFEKKGDADRFDANVRADISRGQYLDPSAGKVTVRAQAHQWLANKVQRDSTLDRLDSEFRNHILPALGDLEMRKVKKPRVQKLIKDLVDDGYAPRTVIRILTDLQALFDAAVGDVVGKNPCDGVEVPGIEDLPRYIPTAQEVCALGEGIYMRYRPVPYIASGCGLRSSEIYGLDLDAIDQTKRALQVRRQLVTTRRNGLHLAPPKSRLSRRTVEIPEVAWVALMRHLEEFPPVPVEILDLSNPKKAGSRKVPLLFTTGNGRPVGGPNRWKLWQAALRAADLQDKELTLHGLRHFFATVLIHAGKDVKTVQLALGHANPTITLNTYTHEWPRSDDRTRGIVDAAFTSVSVVDKRPAAA